MQKPILLRKLTLPLGANVWTTVAPRHSLMKAFKICPPAKKQILFQDCTSFFYILSLSFAALAAFEYDDLSKCYRQCE